MRKVDARVSEALSTWNKGLRSFEMRAASGATLKEANALRISILQGYKKSYGVHAQGYQELFRRVDSSLSGSALKKHYAGATRTALLSQVEEEMRVFEALQPTIVDKAKGWAFAFLTPKLLVDTMKVLAVIASLAWGIFLWSHTP